MPSHEDAHRDGSDPVDFSLPDLPEAERQAAEESLHKSAIGQGTAAHLAQLLIRLTGESAGDFTGVDVDEDSNVVVTADYMWMLYEIVLQRLPRCLAVPEGLPTEEHCQMPDGICHQCAAEGRSLPTDHPLRKSLKDSRREASSRRD